MFEFMPFSLKLRRKKNISFGDLFIPNEMYFGQGCFGTKHLTLFEVKKREK